MKFTFKAKDQNGLLREGTIDATSEKSAIEILQRDNLVLVAIGQVKELPRFLKEASRLWEGTTQKELATFFRQLATLIEAKVPITQSLAAIADQTDNKFMRIVVREIADDIQEGISFSGAMEKHPQVFTPLTTSIVKAGEISGNLQQSVIFVADSIEKSYQLNSKIRGALLYPAFVITVAAIVGFIIITVILPKLTGIIKEMNIDVPWYTKAVMFVGDFMSGYWWAVLAVIFGLIGGFIYYIKTETGKKEWDIIKIKIPVFGKLVRSIYLARLSDNLSLMVVSGIPIVRALHIVSEVVGNSVYQAVVLRAADEVKSGGRISAVFERSIVIPPIVSQMTRIGEETGKLSETLASVTRFYEEEVERISHNLTTLIEPILIVILGFGVAILVFAILLPIYNIAGKL
jgi:type II secretory pathway component PulF